MSEIFAFFGQIHSLARSVRTKFLLLSALLLFGLCACESVDNEKNVTPPQKSQTETAATDRSKHKPQAAAETEATKPDLSAQSEPEQSASRAMPASESVSTADKKKHQLSDQEKELADKMLAFRNRAAGIFSTGYYALPEVLMYNVRTYKRNWYLPKRPDTGGRPQAAKAVQPEAGLFNDAEAASLTKALAEMDRAIVRMLEHYGRLERYVEDYTIVDEGKKGLALAAELGRDHLEFMRARETWLNIVEQRARAAEAALLSGHPLERQIVAAQKLLTNIDQISDLMAAGDSQKELYADLYKNISAEIETGAKPPFPAPPSLERLYRDFLKTAKSYQQLLGMALQEGFFRTQQRELNLAANKCMAAYNAFALATNMKPAPARHD